MFACFSGNLELVRLLLINGVDINAADLKGRTPLMWACYQGNLEIARFLVANHASKSAVSLFGTNALWHIPAGAGHEELRALVTP